MDTIRKAYKAYEQSSDNWQSHLVSTTLFAKNNLKRSDDWCIANLANSTNCSIEKAREMFDNVMKYQKIN